MEKVDHLFPSKIKFLCEQDGVPERKLKARLADLFSSISSVNRAYLVRIDYGNSDEFNVALCIRIEPELFDDIDIKINKVFADMFKTDEHLDLLFLTENREIALSKVCRPFYQKPA